MSPSCVSSRLRAFRSSLVFAALLTALLAPLAHAQSADMTVVKTGPAQALDDSDVSYDVTITNLGPDDATAVDFQDSVPAGMTFVSEVQNSGPAMSCTTPTAGGTGLIDCSTATFPAGSSATFTIVFHITAGALPGTDFTNVANVSEPTDPNDENNSSAVVTSTPPPPRSDLGVTKVGPSFTGQDTDVTYTIIFTNGGPDAAATATWTDKLPGTMTFVSLTQNGGPAMSCTDPGNGVGGTVTCSANAFPAGTTATFTLVGHVPTGTAGGTSFTNIVTTSGANDLNSENDAAQTTVIVETVDVSVNKVGPQAPVTAGGNASYTITITNGGPDAATEVDLSDVLPAGTTFVSFSHDSGVSPTSCGTPTLGVNGTVTCHFITLASGASSQFTLVLNSGSAASIVNTATVTTEGYDTNPENNSSTATTAVTQSADLAITKTGGATATAGTNVTYTIAASNAGPSDATAVSVTDTLPANLTYVSVTQTSGPTFNCTGGPTITCTIATFSAGSSASFDVVAHVASSAPSGGISNIAAVSSSTFDPNGGNNSSQADTTVATSADLSVTKNGPAAVAPGTDISYTVTVANAGPSDASSVSLTDATPPGTTFVSEAQNNGPTFNCTTPAAGGTGTITCTIPSLVAGASASFTIVLHVTPTTTGTISNTANATTTTPDPTPANGTSNSSALVSPATTDVSITKTANTGRFAPGSNATYTIVATNNGPAVATNVVVTDVLPAGTTLVSATPTQGSCSGTTTVTCTLGVLLPSSSASIALVVTLPQTYGPVANTATVSSDNADSNPANNSATATVVVASEIPSLSPLGLLFLVLILGAAGLFVTRN
jgi:uncharacterized repeat protein (TIGR01451 family)